MDDDGDCSVSPPGTPCGRSELCGSGECDGFGRCVDKPLELLCASRRDSDLRLIVVVVSIGLAIVFVALAVALWAIVGRRRRLLRKEGAELAKLESDVRAERGLGSSLAAAAAAFFPEPPDGTAMTPDGDVDRDAKERQDGLPVLQSKLRGIKLLRRETTAPAFNNGDTPYTLLNLRAVHSTPDVSAAGGGGGGGGGDTGPGSLLLLPEDMGQCVEQHWFEEAGGPDGFENAILSAMQRTAVRAAAMGTTPNDADAPTSRNPDANPATIDVAWELEKAKRRCAAGDGGSSSAAEAAAAELADVENRSAKFCESSTEAKETTPAHVAFYLFEAYGGARSCVMGERCIARRTLYHKLADPPPPGHPGGPKSKMGVVLQEFLTDTERSLFDRFGTLPEVRKPCIACIRVRNTLQCGSESLAEAVHMASQTHFHPVEVPGGYRRQACLQPKKSGPKGVCMPTRGFCTRDYIPTTMQDAVREGVISASQSELGRIQSAAAPIRGYLEDASVLFNDQTAAMGSQAVCLGTEPACTSAGAFAHQNRSDVSSRYSSSTAAERGGGGRDESEAETGSACSKGMKEEDGGGGGSGDRTSCCDLGEHAGSWRHLVVEASARLAISVETTGVVFGPFCGLCRAIAAALRECESERRPRRASAELVSLVRRLRKWRKAPPPEPLAGHSIYAACYLRRDIAKDLRETVHLDAVEIARRKTDARRRAAVAAAVTASPGVPDGFLPSLLQETRSALWEGLAADAEDGDVDELIAENVRGGPEAWASERREWQEHRRRLVEEAVGRAGQRFDERLRPYPEPTAAQRAINERIRAVCDGDDPELAGLRALLEERRKKRAPQKMLERVLQLASEFDSAQRPLCRFLARLRVLGLPTDDAALLGVCPGGGEGQPASSWLSRPPAFLRAAFGCVDPDARTPSLRVPRRPHRITIAASASTMALAVERRFAQSGLPPTSIPPAPAAFAVPNLPLCPVRFPSHRQALRRAVRAGTVDLGSSWKRAVAPNDLLREFWKAVAVVRRLGPDAQRDLLGPRTPRGPSYVAATLLGRVALAEKVQRLARASGDHILEFRAHAFARTHGALYSAIDWGDPSDWTDLALTGETSWDDEAEAEAEAATPREERRANLHYPYDGRVFIEEDAVPIAAELTMCSFFEQSSDPDVSKNVENVIDKIMPRACVGRQLDIVCEQVVRFCPAFSVWLLGAIRCFLLGSYAHARCRPSFEVAQSVCEPFLARAGADLELRVRLADTRAMAEKYERKCRKMTTAVELFGPNQFLGAIDVALALRRAAICVKSVRNTYDAEPFEMASRKIREAVAASVCREVNRRARCVTPAILEGEFAGLCSGKKTLDEVALRLCGADASALVKSVELLGSGGLSSRRPEVAREAARVIATIVTDVVTGSKYDDARVAVGVRDVFARRGESEREDARVAVGVHDVSARRGEIKYIDALDAFREKLLAETRRTLETLSEAGTTAVAAAAAAAADSAAAGARTWPLSRESVREACAAACSRALDAEIRAEEDGFMHGVAARHPSREPLVEAFCRMMVTAAADAAISAVDPALVVGLAGVALEAIGSLAGDMVDMWDPTVKVCGFYDDTIGVGAGVRRQVLVSAIRMIEAGDIVPDEEEGGSGGDRPDVSAAKAAIFESLRSRQKRDELAADRSATAVLARMFLSAISAVQSDPAARWGRPREPRSAATRPADLGGGTTPERLILLAGRLSAKVVARAGSVAESTIVYAESVVKCEILRKTWEEHRAVEVKLRNAPSFVTENIAMCQAALREALAVQFSRNPGLMAVFVRRGAWFPSFLDNVIETCDAVRGFVCRHRRIPADAKVTGLTKARTRGTRQSAPPSGGGGGGVGCWWSGQVYRLHKWDFATRMAKTAEFHAAQIVSGRFRIGPAFRIDPERVTLMRRYVLATAGGGDADQRPNLERDREVLWRFGMRDHGLNIVSRLHAAYANFAGLKELYRIWNQFSVSEFLLALEYYCVLVSANSVCVVPLLSPSLSEAIAAALRERNNYGNGDLPPNLLNFVVCDCCNSIHTQINSSLSERPSKLTSCSGVVAGPDGDYVCLGRRNPGNKKDKRAGGGDGGEAEGAAEPLRLPKSCQKTPVRRIPAAGCLVLVSPSQKKIAKGEKSTDSRFPIMLRPCCATWGRFELDDWGPDGYRCRSCSKIRNTGPALPPTCAVCGCELHPPCTARSAERRGKQVTTAILSRPDYHRDPAATWASCADMRWLPLPGTQRKRRTTTMLLEAAADDESGADGCDEAEVLDSGVVPRRPSSPPPCSPPARKFSKTADGGRRVATEDDEEDGGVDYDEDGELRSAEADIVVVKSKKKRNVYDPESVVPGLDGHDIPVPAGGSQCVIRVIDDDYTGLVVPVPVCRLCYRENARTTWQLGPILMSHLRARVKAKLEEPRLASSTCSWARKTWHGRR